MNIACSSCPAKYAVPDEKVRGRKVRITCKRCGAAIIVDGTELAAAPAPADAPKGEPVKTDAVKTDASKTDAGEPAKQRTMLGGLQAAAPGAAPAETAPSKSIALPKPGGAKAGVAGGAAFPSPAKAAAVVTPAAKAAAVVTPAAKAAATPAKAAATPAAKAVVTPAAATKAAVEKPWTVAVTDDDHRDMMTTQVVELYAAHTIDAETFVWRDGMEDWLTPFEIPDIAAALKARGLESRTNDPVDAPPETGSSAGATGSWHEPGKWKDSDSQKKPDATYDDVTVAMTAPKAQALLDAAISAEEANASKVAEAAAESKPEAPTAPPPTDNPTPITPDALGSGSDGPFRLPFEEPPEVDGGVISSAPARAAVSPRRAERAREDAPDLFAPAAASEEAGPRSRMPSVPPEGQGALTGARNESSVLFSLDQLAGKPKAKTATKRNDKADAEALLLGNASSDGDAPSSVANLGGGALFGAAAMAAPDFMAPTAASAAQHSRPSSGPPPQATERKGSGMGLWIALGALVLAGGGGAAFVMLKPAPTPPIPSVTTPVAMPTPAATTAEPVPAAPLASGVAEAASGAPSAAASAPTAPVTSGAVPAPTAAAPAAPTAAKTQTPAATAAAPTTKPATAAAAATPTPQAPADGPDFDKDAASAALSTAAATAEGQCASQDGTHGVGKVTITFTNSGRATNAVVSGDFAGSALGGCVAKIFRSAHVPAFSGDAVRVTKTVRIP